MKEVRKFALIFTLWSILLAPVAGLMAAGQEPIKIRFSHVVSENTPKGQGALLFKKLAEERLAGRVEVEVFPNSIRFTDEQVLLGLLFDDVQMAAPSLAKFRRFSDSIQVFDLPFLFNDLEQVHRFQSGETGRSLLDSMIPRGIKGLSYWDNGMRVISANRSIRTPADLAGLLLRIEPSAVIAAQYKSLGANTFALPFNRVSDGLRLGLVDGQENSWSNIQSQRFHEFQDYLVETNHSFQGYMVVTSVKFWDGLPADIREALQQILAEVSAEVNRIAVEKQRSSREAVIKAMGPDRIVSLSDEERAVWRQAMQPIWKEFEHQIGVEVVNAAAEE
ncbi:MAG: DctP family TRAP transporter solute-binding subunit [Gammaproteobacteria bacterium]|nr:DctP family TRAP transporter solute-binding subunit [Gammaproteobacteria bacterium]